MTRRIWICPVCDRSEFHRSDPTSGDHPRRGMLRVQCAAIPIEYIAVPVVGDGPAPPGGCGKTYGECQCSDQCCGCAP